ncbi:hypothetical protein [Streptomyces sp. NPDC092307]|uniref:hypothetical protein n=1 Tax=Streptomyces sp. NPDC092307 TaxID=3366013 RepID=UPI003811D133
MISLQRTEMKSGSSSTETVRGLVSRPPAPSATRMRPTGRPAGLPVQLREGLTAIVTHDDAKPATTVLRSYTANHEILRVGVNGVQARIVITNGMTVSSFAHAKTGYGTPADKFLQKNVDHVGVLGRGEGQVMTSLPSGGSAELQLWGSE